jgi:hypothetical protein
MDEDVQIDGWMDGWMDERMMMSLLFLGSDLMDLFFIKVFSRSKAKRYGIKSGNVVAP